MNTPLQSRWVPKKESVEVFLDQLGGSEEARLLATQGGYSRLQEDLLNQILQRAPEMQALNALVSAQYRELDASKKAFSRPQVQLKANVNQTLWKDKTGGLDLGSLLGEAGQNLGTFPDTSWNVALQAQLPILSGGARTARKEKAVSTLEKLQVERVALKQGLEARFLAALDSAAASQPEMALRIDGAEAAERTLHAVQDAYAQGVEGLLTLLDAQNAALNLRLAARQAEYAFLQDWADVQRARGQLERLHSH
jgi:outer membrane protein TolC